MAFCTFSRASVHTSMIRLYFSSSSSRPRLYWPSICSTFFSASVMRVAFSSGTLTSSMPTVVPDTVAKW
ncbi:MAG: hypothetical protein BWY85_02419 [Firmicutes bacterium ADurb.Bin506]|nr:MAG: hypothetical protein BWY85_02419 [Firmicutes bacterium ADurb.Bin506]